MARKVKTFLSDDRWTIIEPLSPEAKSTQKGVRKRIDNRRVLERILYCSQAILKWILVTFGNQR